MALVFIFIYQAYYGKHKEILSNVLLPAFFLGSGIAIWWWNSSKSLVVAMILFSVLMLTGSIKDIALFEMQGWGLLGILLFIIVPIEAIAILNETILKDSNGQAHGNIIIDNNLFEEIKIEEIKSKETIDAFDVLKLLPDEMINCGECGCTYCLDFAKNLLIGDVSIEKCPYIPKELREIIAVYPKDSGIGN